MAKQKPTKPQSPKKNIPWLPILGGVAILGIGGYYLSQGASDKDAVTSEEVQKHNLSSVKALKVFVENSGSMDGYVAPVNSQLKSDMNALVSGMSIIKNPASSAPLVDTIELNYINSDILPIKSSVSHFFQNLSVASFQSRGGSRISTSLEDLIDRVEQETHEGEVAILVSDMILGLASGQSAESVSTNIETTLRRYMMKRPEWAIVVWRMLSDFQGKYYEKGRVVPLTAKRPYYIIMMGDRSQLYGLLAKGQLADNQPFFKNRTHQMTLEQAIPTPKYSISPNAVWGSISLDRSDKYVIKNAETGRTPSGEQALAFELKMQIPETLQDESRLLDPESYQVTPNSYKLSRVRQGKDGAVYLRLESSEIVLGDIAVSLKQTMPKWIADIHAEENTDILNPDNLSRTYGIKYILEGLQRPYESEAASLFTLKVTLK